MLCYQYFEKQVPQGAIRAQRAQRTYGRVTYATVRRKGNSFSCTDQMFEKNKQIIYLLDLY